MLRGGLAQHSTGLGIECCIQRKSSMPEILKSVTLSATWRKRQHRVQAVQCLDRSLLIHAENHGISGRFEVEADHVRRFFSEIRIIAGHVATQLMWLKACLGPSARHTHVTDPQLRGEFSRAPMSRTVLGTASRAVQNPGLQFWSLVTDPTTLVPPVQSRETLAFESLSPKPDGVDATTHGSGDRPLSLAFSQPKDDVSPTNVFGRKTAASQSRL